MATTHRFLADPSEPSEVMAWFRALDEPPREVPMAQGLALHFKHFGPLTFDTNGSIDPSASPVATVFRPRVKRGVLWTVGEVRFLSTPLKQRFPGLHKVSSAFSRWLATHECVYSNKSTANHFNYYLEGSVKNWDPPVFALASGARALANEQYFVAEEDNEFVLQRLCKVLRLRGVVCAEA